MVTQVPSQQAEVHTIPLIKPESEMVISHVLDIELLLNAASNVREDRMKSLRVPLMRYQLTKCDLTVKSQKTSKSIQLFGQ